MADLDDTDYLVVGAGAAGMAFTDELLAHTDATVAIVGIDRDEIVLDEGRIPTDARTMHVHCAARGLGTPPQRPIFEPGRLTSQPILWGFACYQAAMLAVVAATVDSDEEKNRLCPPIPYWNRTADYASTFLRTMVGDQARAAHPTLAKWAKTTRLNPTSGLAAFREDPAVAATRERTKRFAFPAAVNLQKILRARGVAGSPS